MYCPHCKGEMGEIGYKQTVIYGECEPVLIIHECEECDKRFIIIQEE